MRAVFSPFAFVFVFCCIGTRSFSQEKTGFNLNFRVGAGNNVAMRQFFAEDVAFNFPTTSFVQLGLFSNVLERNSKSWLFGIEMQAINYYPTPSDKANLAFLSLLAGRTRKYDIAQWVSLKQTNGISLNTLAEATASNAVTNPDFITYTGSPFTNLNIGAFTNLQVLFAGTKRQNRRMDYGIGFDIAYKGYQLYKDNRYPWYLIKNRFLQYGININVNYNF